MDLIGSLGYHGQPIQFIDTETLIYSVGAGFCIYSTAEKPAHGPREIIIGQDKCFNTYTSHTASHRIAYSIKNTEASIEIINYPEQTKLTYLSNNTNTIIEYLIFSKNGEYLGGISSFDNHNILIWSIDTGALLCSEKLKLHMKKLLFNPIEKDQSIIYNIQYFTIITCQDILGRYSLKYHTIQLPDLGTYLHIKQDKDLIIHIDNDKIKFTTWSPSNRILIGLESGRLLDLDSSSGQMVSRGLLVSGGVEPEVLEPDNVALSATHLIISTIDSVYWYDLRALDSFVESISTVNTVFLVPVHSRRLPAGPATSLVVDPKFESLYIGSSSGQILALPIDVPLRPEGSDPLEDSTGQAAPDADQAEELLGQARCDLQEGAVLTSTALCLPIVSISSSAATKKTSNMMYYFITGSHLGQLTFWQQPTVESDAITGQVGVRKTNLKSLVVAKTISGTDLTSICSLLVTSASTRDGSALIAVGTAGGALELIRVDAVENEEEEDSDAEDEVALREKEASESIQLCLKKTCLLHLFSGALSVLTKPDETSPLAAVKKGVLLAGSYFDNRLYLLCESGSEGVYEPQLQLALDPSLGPTSAWWSVDTLCVGAYSGEVYNYSIKLIQEAVATGPVQVTADQTVLPELPCAFKWHVGADGIVAGMGLKLLDKAVIVSSSDLYLRSTCRTSPLFEAPEVTLINIERECDDYVTAFATSPNGKYLALGSSDGSLTIWGTAREPFQLLSKVSLHSDAVISLSFSSDSSQLLACGADGSFFICTVDRFQRLTYDFETAKHSVRQKKFLRGGSVVDIPAVRESLWLDERVTRHQQDVAVDYKPKVKDLLERILQLRVQLRGILDSQQTADDLDRLEPEELVVDVQGKAALEKENQQHELEVVGAYERYCLVNELYAARVRDETVSKMAQARVQIEPFLETSGRTAAMGLSSFPVCKLSDQERKDLHRLKTLRVLELRTQLLSRTPDKLPDAPWILGETGAGGFPSDLSGGGSTDGASEPGKDRRFSSFEEGFDVAEALARISYDKVDSLLYRPSQLRTTVQKRAQIALLGEVVRSAKLVYNERFQSLLNGREDVISAVRGRNERIQQIVTELDLKVHSVSYNILC